MSVFQNVAVEAFISMLIPVMLHLYTSRTMLVDLSNVSSVYKEIIDKRKIGIIKRFMNFKNFEK